MELGTHNVGGAYITKGCKPIRTSELKILRIKKREYRDGIKRKETRLGWS